MNKFKYGDSLNVPKTAGNFRRIRKANGYTQIELAEKLGCKQSYLSKVELGQAVMTLQMAVSFCALFGIGLDQLVVINDDSLPELRIVVE